jgi:L-fucose isomerase-like protein
MSDFRPILINQDVMLATTCAIEALLSDYLGHQKPQIADRFFDFLKAVSSLILSCAARSAADRLRPSLW